jgi:hypothetical protein
MMRPINVSWVYWCMRSLCTLLVLGIMGHCFGAMNNERIRYAMCDPAACSEEGSCYCTDRKNGWFDGGAGYSRNLRSGAQSYCYKAGVGDCECSDCGQIFIFDNVQCQDSRCDDETEVAVTGPGSADSRTPCYRIDPVQGKVYTGRRTYFHCYRTQVKCDPSKCLHGERLTGCMRVSSGACQSCGALPRGHYWTTRGGCGIALCDAVQPGFYMTAPCGNSTNTAKVHCSQYTGNPNAPAFANPVAQYYCPGGPHLPVRVPSFARVNQEYTDFNCDSGYFKAGAECRACLPGSACMYDRSFKCKADYYTDNYAQSACKKCTSGCTYKNELPMRCPEGSIQNSRCVTCGACGLWPATGVNCVRDLVEFVKLSELCSPRNVTSDVIVCQ